MIRVSALTLLIAGAIAGNSIPNAISATAIHQSSVPGPTPYCNPFEKKCPPIR
jgi:hypothetical protein